MSMWTSMRGSSSSTRITKDDLQTGSGARESIAELQTRIDTLVMVNMAMWSLLRDKTGLTEDDLLERVREVDLADGVEDVSVKIVWDPLWGPDQMSDIAKMELNLF